MADLKLAPAEATLFRRFCDKTSPVTQPTLRQYRLWKRGKGQPYALAKKESGHNKKLRAELEQEGIDG